MTTGEEQLQDSLPTSLREREHGNPRNKRRCSTFEGA